jgi:hypothetical protein
MLKRYLEPNEYGGQTIMIEVNPLFDIYIKEKDTKYYEVILEEHVYNGLDQIFKYQSSKNLIETITDAYDKTFDFFKKRPDQFWHIDAKNFELSKIIKSATTKQKI